METPLRLRLSLVGLTIQRLDPNGVLWFTKQKKSIKQTIPLSLLTWRACSTLFRHPQTVLVDCETSSAFHSYHSPLE